MADKGSACQILKKGEKVNMDYTAERYFVNAFIKKSRRERLLFELTTPAKRYDGIDRFCHQSADLLDTRKIKLQGEDLERQKEFISFVKKHDEACCLLSPDPDLNEQTLTLSEAVEAARKAAPKKSTESRVFTPKSKPAK